MPRSRSAPAAEPSVPRTELDPETLALLRRPFTPSVIRWKIQATKKGDASQALAVFYMDARMVGARLDHVVGPAGWVDDYRPVMEHNPASFAAAHFPVECRLSVLGVTKMDVGVYQKREADELAVKSAYSDALKRAAVKFGVGAFLYALPKVWAETVVGNDGKARGFSPAGERRLAKAYADWLAASPFGAPLDHGYALHDPAETEPPADQPPADSAPPSGAEPPAGGRGPRVISEAQRRKMWATAGEYGYDPAKVRTIVAVVCGTSAPDAVTSTQRIPTSAFQDVLKAFDAVRGDDDLYTSTVAEWREANPSLAEQLDAAIEGSEAA